MSENKWEPMGKWVEKGVSYLKQGEYDKAIEAFNKAIAIDPNDRSAWFAKGQAFSELGEYDNAIEAFNKAIAITSNDALAWGSKGDAFSELGEYDNAIEAFNKAIAIDPEDGLSWESKGDAFSELGEYDKAIEAYNKAIDTNPNFKGAKEKKDLATKKIAEQNCGTELKEDSLFKLSFNWSGRFSRRQFIKYNVCIFLIVGSIFLWVELTGLHVRPESTELYVLLTLVAIGQISNSIAVIRRLHDLDKSGWYYLLIYIPIFLGLSFIFYIGYIYLLLKKGKEIGETRWG